MDHFPRKERRKVSSPCAPAIMSAATAIADGRSTGSNSASLTTTTSPASLVKFVMTSPTCPDLAAFGGVFDEFMHGAIRPTYQDGVWSAL